MVTTLVSQAKEKWNSFEGWVKAVIVIGGAITVLSQFAGIVLSITLDDRYVMASEGKSFVTQADMLAQSRQFNQQIGDVRKFQYESERRRLRDELYKLKAKNDPVDRQRILQLEDDIKDIERQLRRLETGQ